jgi:hypothetical protein
MLIAGFTILRCALLSFFKSPPPAPVTKPREICTKCFGGLVSNILQGDKNLTLNKGLNLLLVDGNGVDGRITRPNC